MGVQHISNLVHSLVLRHGGTLDSSEARSNLTTDSVTFAPPFPAHTLPMPCGV